MNTAAPAPTSRIDRAMLATAQYPNVITLPVRFDDLDVLWHVNNASAIVMLQEARVLYTRGLALPPIESFGLRTVVGAMTVEFAGELNYPGVVEIASGILRLGNSSYTFAQVIRQDGKDCVYSLVTMVVSGPDGGVPIPDPLRTALNERGMVRLAD
jgi:acyl-CoA thioester hydrolase